MKRKILFALMIMALLTCVLAISVSAATVLIDEIYYDLNDSTMQATVSSSNQKNCKKSVVVIPSKVTYNNAEYNVTAIAAKAFGSQNSGGGNSNITSVTVPSLLQALENARLQTALILHRLTAIPQRLAIECSRIPRLQPWSLKIQFKLDSMLLQE